MGRLTDLRPGLSHLRRRKSHLHRLKWRTVGLIRNRVDAPASEMLPPPRLNHITMPAPGLSQLLRPELSDRIEEVAVCELFKQTISNSLTNLTR